MNKKMSKKMSKTLITIIRMLFLLLFVFLMVIGKPIIWLGLFAVSLLLAPFFGRIYCGYICPMNTLMIPTEKISKKLNLQTSSKPKFLKNGWLTWVALFISLILMFLGKKLLSVNIPILPIWAGVAILVTLRYKPEVFHNLICPFGALQKTFARISLFGRRINKECIGCGLCTKVCPSQAVTIDKETHMAVIDSKLCHQCTNCKDVCPKSAIDYGKRKNERIET